MAHENVKFDGKTAGEHWDERYGEKAYHRFKGTPKNFGPNASGYQAEQYEQKKRNDWNNIKMRSAAVGGWAAGINDHTKTLYEEDGLNYNDMRKYANAAGIKDINNESDVEGIREYIDSIYTSQAELDEAIGGLTPEKEAEETDPSKIDRPVTLSDTVAEAQKRTEAFGNPNATTAYKNKFKSDAVNPPENGTDIANEETNSFLDKFTMNLRGTHKPAKEKNLAVARDVINAEAQI